MIIELDNLTETQPWSQCGSPSIGRLVEHSGELRRDLDWRKEKMVCVREPDLHGVDGVQSGFLDYLATAYSRHQKVTIQPQDIWYVVLSEIGKVIETNVEACRPLFTRSASKIAVMVQTDDPSEIDLDAVAAQLRDLVPVNMDDFLPDLSTHTLSSRYACVAAFCAGVKQYYEYMTYACGLPAIKLTGTVEDWRALDERTVKIGEMFAGVGLSEVTSMWLGRVRVILKRCIDALEGRVDVDDWKSIYMHKNVGSGGQKDVSGWITSLYLNGNAQRLECFPTTWSIVPYKNLDTGREFTGVHGAFIRRRDADDFVSCDYAEVILEKRPVKLDARGYPVMEIERVEVKATPRKLATKWTLEPSGEPAAKIEVSDEVVGELAADLISKVR